MLTVSRVGRRRLLSLSTGNRRRKKQQRERRDVEQQLAPPPHLSTVGPSVCSSFSLARPLVVPGQSREGGRWWEG